MEEDARLRRYLRPEWLIAPALAACLVLVLVTSNRNAVTQRQDRLWATTLADIDLQLTQAHLWLEQALAGDVSIDEKREIHDRLLGADASCDVLLGRGGGVSPLSGSSRPVVKAACGQIDSLKALARDRLRRRRAAADTEADARFDRAYLRADSLLTEARGIIDRDSRRNSSTTEWIDRGVAALLLVIFAAIVLMVRRSHANRERLVRSEREQSTYRRTQGEFVDALQSTRTEEEADELLKRHLERCLPGVRATILRSSNSADRLVSTTALRPDSPLVRVLHDAEPESCVAVRMARPHARDSAAQPLVVCRVCGEIPGKTTCTPSLVGGEVIGSVLVEHGDGFGARDATRLDESVRQAAPVLANLRNLALAELRAATDQLTGLANSRAAHDTVRRMAAHAIRSQETMALVLFDLDHFKAINDTYGHPAGDEVLAAVGRRLAGFLRASDFAARYGGEEFLLALPDTPHDNALVVAEKLREEISGLRVGGSGRRVTASLGVALLPDDAPDVEGLTQAADRALYAAKHAGRDCVRSARDLPPPSPAPPVATAP